ncbi:MAG: hypothetical protein Q8O47_03025 [Candidatus Bathyarchaeota archaeon]|nr:hypothetical protein [Candidatus Bathyarchaeota archaeon]
MDRRLVLDYLTPIVLCLVISVGFVRLFILGGLSSSIHSSPSGFYEQLVWTLSLTLVGLIGVTFLYWMTRRRKDFEIRVVVALIVAPTSAILVIIVSQTVLMVVAKAVSSFMASIIVLISLYVAVFSMIFIISNVFSSRVRNFIFIVYGALLGSFVSLLLPTVSLVVMLVAVAAFDLVILNTGWVLEAIRGFGASRGKSSRLSYVGEDVEVGMGELVFYSFLPAHVEAYYGSVLLVTTLLMIGIGVSLNLWVLEKRGVVAGLPAPIFLGLAPLIVSLLL